MVPARSQAVDMASTPRACVGDQLQMQWERSKSRALGQIDLSRKGSVDEAIVPLVQYVNSRDEYFTTSSCAGRISVFSEDREQAKKGCHWLLVSHEPLELEQVCTMLGSSATDVPGYTFFKFEPFIAHVMCRSLQDASILLQVAVGAGFRNSGISCGRTGKIMVAIRSTHSLQSPIAYEGRMLVSEEYLTHLVKIGNSKMEENASKVAKFFDLLKGQLETRTHTSRSLVPDHVPQRRKQPDKDDTDYVDCTGTEHTPNCVTVDSDQTVGPDCGDGLLGEEGLFSLFETSS